MASKRNQSDSRQHTFVTKVQLMRVLDISDTTFNTYDAKTLIVRGENRTFDLDETCRTVIKHLRAAAGNHSTSGDLKEEKLQEEIRELRLANAKKEGELVDIEEVHGVIRKALVSTSDWMESLPDALEAQGVIAPGMTGRFIEVLDSKREALLSMVLDSAGDE